MTSSSPAAQSPAAEWLAAVTSRVTSPHSAWLASPELHEPLARIASGTSTPADVEQVTAAAPPEQRDRVRFIARAIRVMWVLHDARERATERARTLMDRALNGDKQAAFDALRLVSDKGLLADPPEPRLTGAVVGPDWAIERAADEAVLAQDVLPLRDESVVVALVGKQSATPEPAFDDEQLAHALARAMVAAVSR